MTALINAVRLGLVVMCSHRFHRHGDPYRRRCLDCTALWCALSADHCTLPHRRRVPKGCHLA